MPWQYPVPGLCLAYARSTLRKHSRPTSVLYLAFSGNVLTRSMSTWSLTAFSTGKDLSLL